AARIALGEDWLALKRPADAELGIVPEEGALVLGRPVIGRLVEELGLLGEHEEAVREAWGDPGHALGGGIEIEADRLAEGRGAAAQVDGDVEHFAGDDAHQLSLRLADLVVQPAQDAAARARVV